MAEHPFMPLATDAYLGDTTHLTTTEHGAYLLLLMAMWRSRDGSLPNEDKFLARVCRLTTVQWARVKPTIMAFLTVTEDGVTQDRLMRERAFVRQHRQSQSDKANARWRKEKGNADAPALPVQCPPPTPHLEGKEEPKGSSKKARGCRLATDWSLPADWRDWAITELGLPAEFVQREAQRFLDYWISVPGAKGVKLDWQATWRNWMRKAEQDRPKLRVVGQPQPGDTKIRARDGQLMIYGNHYDGWLPCHG